MGKMCCLALLLVLTTMSGWGETFTFSDDFTHYPVGGDGSPAWVTGGIDWRVTAGGFACSDADKDFAMPAKAPGGKRVTVTAELSLHATTAPEWKVAGVAVRQDERNYWHLALVESPDTQGKKHFIELTEMLDDVWLGQSQAGSKLTVRENNGSSFDWQYNHPYRLKLTLSPEGVNGTVSEIDGTPRASIAYAFDAKAVTSGKPALDDGGFQAEFSAVNALVDDPTPPTAPPARPAYSSRGYAAITLPPSGFFTTRKLGDTWWLFDPAGRAFIIIGTDHVNYQAHWCEKLGYAPYHRNCERLYPAEAKWAATEVQRLTDWGFTCLGVNASESARYRGLPHQELLGLGTCFSAKDWITPKTTWTGFPNVFSPRFAAYCAKQAQLRCAPEADDPWLIGYFIDNELEWQAWTSGGLLQNTLKLPADNPARQALLALLRGRYAAVAAFNQAWGTRLASIDALATLPAAPTAAAREDERAFTRLVAERYFAITTAAIRQADPHHLIMGCRFAGWVPDILDIAGKYCDVISINCYRRLNLHSGAFVDGFPQELLGWYAKAGKPLLITEWSFPALDAGLPCKHGAGQRVPTQADKAFAFTAFQQFLLTTPYVLGSNYFMWADEPALGISSTFPEDSNYGLVNEQDVPYVLLTKAAAKLHALAYPLHSGNIADIAVTADDGGFTLRNNGKVAGAVTLALLTDGTTMRRDVLTLAPGAKLSSQPLNEPTPPGGHFLVAHLTPAEGSRPRRPEELTATTTRYQPGARWPAGSKMRLPLLITNPTAAAQQRALVELSLPAEFDPAAPLAAFDTAGAPVPIQVDRLPDGALLALDAGALPPWGSRTVFLYPGVTPAHLPPAVACTQDGGLLRIDNGVLTLERTTATSSNTFERITLRGVEMGGFRPVIWQLTDRNQWISPDTVTDITVYSGPVHLLLDVTSAFTAPNTADPQRARSFHTQYRFVIEPGRPWFCSRFRWLDNTDTLPLTLKGYYHYLLSSINGKMADDVAKENYWTSAAGYNFGVVSTADDIRVNLWKDPQGSEHPDIYRPLDLTLPPGTHYAQPQPLVYLLAAPSAEWETVQQQLDDARKVGVTKFAEEKSE